MTWVELNWFEDAELLGRIGRRRLAATLAMLAPCLARQNIPLPDPNLPDARYFDALAGILRSQPIKVVAYLPPFLTPISKAQASTPPAAGAAPPQPLLPSPSPVVEALAPSPCSLRRETACWVLRFNNGCAFLKYEIGLAYVAYLLSRPDESVPSATLFSKFSASQRKELGATELPDPETGLSEPVADGVGVGQFPRDKDEAEARRRYYAQLGEYKATFTDGSIPEPEREDARRLYDELLAFLKQHYRPEPDPGGDVTRVVHRSIQRLCASLRKPVAGQGGPEAAAVAFAEYIERNILVPSRRYTRARAGANVRVARGELAGRLIFECPPGHHWTVVA